MKIFLWLTALFISYPSLAQNYVEYYHALNKAKVSVIEGDRATATNLYFDTFQKFEFAFARDCYNAIELAASAEDETKLVYFIKRGLQQGIPFEIIARMKSLESFKKTPFWKDVLQQKDSLRTLYNASINWEIRNEVTQMFREDQEIRERYYQVGILKRKKTGKQWEALNTTQVKRLIEITKQYGFPGERLIGLDTDEMHPKITTSSLSAGMPIVLFIHHFSQPNSSYDKLLLTQISLGNILNEHYATICDFEAKFGKNKYPNNGHYALKHTPKKFTSEEFTNKRNAIGLLSNDKLKEFGRVSGLIHFWKRLY